MTPAQIIQDYMLGVAVGDSIALPYEGLGPKRVAALLGQKNLRHRLIFGRGMVSDDTEHMMMALRAYRASQGDADIFARRLAWELRLWTVMFPAGIGRATLKACGKLWRGVPPHKSGVPSAGNGPIMRSGILGLLCESEEQLARYVDIPTRITHTDPRACDGALAIALAARVAAQYKDQDLLEPYQDALERLLPDEGMRQVLERTIICAQDEMEIEEFVGTLQCRRGVSGFIAHTVPAVVHLWLTSHPRNFSRAIEVGVRLGGDTDSVCAALGGLMAIGAGKENIPEKWIKRLVDFPLSVKFIKDSAQSRGAGAANGPTPRILAQLPRNAVFFGAVLAHIGRRALPPYAARQR